MNQVIIVTCKPDIVESEDCQVFWRSNGMSQFPTTSFVNLGNVSNNNYDIGAMSNCLDIEAVGVNFKPCSILLLCTSFTIQGLLNACDYIITHKPCAVYCSLQLPESFLNKKFLDAFNNFLIQTVQNNISVYLPLNN